MKKVLKKVLALILALVCAINLAVVSFAEETVIGGNCGENATWSFDKVTGEITISGYGDMNDYSINNNSMPYYYPVPWATYKPDIKSIKISSGITYIGMNTFRDCVAVTKIVIPEGVTRIGKSAFGGCKALKDVVIPESVTVMGSNAFLNSQQIRNIYYAGDQEMWETANFDDAFDNYSSYQLVCNYGKAVGHCGESATWSFNEESGNLLIEGFDSIKESLANWGLIKAYVTAVEIADGITAIGEKAFDGFSALKEVYLPETVTEIAAGAFSNCENLSIVTMLADSVSVENSAFTSANSRLFFVAKSGTQTLSSLEGAGFSTVPFSVVADEKMGGKKVLSFGGKTVLYDFLDYNYISNLMFSVPDLYYVKFDKMTLYGVPTSQDFIIDLAIPEANVDVNEEYLTLTDVYMYMKVDGENVSFAEILERISNDDYSGIVFTDYTEDSEEKTFIQQVAEFFDRIEESFEDTFSFATEAFNAIVGTITKLWKKLWK